jgi:hypothetical protein
MLSKNIKVIGSSGRFTMYAYYLPTSRKILFYPRIDRYYAGTSQ